MSALASLVINPTAEGVLIVLPTGVCTNAACPVLWSDKHGVGNGHMEGYSIRMLDRPVVHEGGVASQKPPPVLAHILRGQSVQRCRMSTSCQPA